MKEYLDDICFVAGSGLLIYATSLWSTIGAWYVAGGALIVAGIIIGVGGKTE